MHKLILILCLMIAEVSVAKDLGKEATTFKIEEEAFTVMMKRKLEEVDMEAERKKMEKTAIDRVNNPIPVVGITGAEKNRTFYYDPTYILDEDAVLPCGKVLHKAGTRVNPLEHMDLNRRLFFVDSRNAKQVEWLKGQLNNPLPQQKEPVEDRVILVGGSVFKLQDELEDRHKSNVYFDQSGELTTKFGIKHSPAIAMQEGLKVRIDEINLTN
jgi:conjugal transfer pilus assembly protein TraW